MIFFKYVPDITKIQLYEQSKESSLRTNAVCSLTICRLKIKCLFLSSLFCQTLTKFVKACLGLKFYWFYFFKANLKYGTSSFHSCIRLQKTLWPRFRLLLPPVHLPRAPHLNHNDSLQSTVPTWLTVWFGPPSSSAKGSLREGRKSVRDGTWEKHL